MIFSLSSAIAVMSLGFSAPLSSMKSPKFVSSLSPTGACSEIGCCAIFSTARTRSTGSWISSATSSGVGSRPYSWTKLLLHPHQLVDRLDHVHRNANRARLVGNRAGDGLANPPRRVGRKFVAAAILEFLHRLHQAHVAFLDQVEKGEAAVGVFFGDRNDEAQVGLDHFGFGAKRFAQPAAQFLVALGEIPRSKARAWFQFPAAVWRAGWARAAFRASSSPPAGCTGGHNVRRPGARIPR